MNDRLARYKPAPGLHTLLTPKPGVLDYIHFSILSLAANEKKTVRTPGEETVVVLLNGEVNFRAGKNNWRAARKDVFRDPASTVLLPPGDSIEIEAAKTAELAIASAKASWTDGGPRFYGSDAIHVRDVGRGNWQRQVKTIIDEDAPAHVLIVGETVNPPGNWSSYPPHRHDFDRPPEEVAMEEVYFYRFDPPNGFGFQRIYTDDRRVDQTWCIEHNSALPIYEGFHPVVAAPGYSLYYLWALAGRKRELHPYTDPQHAWVMK